MEQVNSPEDSIIAVEAWLKALAERDLEGMKKVAADDYIQWHATVRKNLTKDEEFDMLEEGFKVMDLTFRNVELTPMTAPGTMLIVCGFRTPSSTAVNTPPIEMLAFFSVSSTTLFSVLISGSA